MFDLLFRLMQIGPEKASFVQRDYPVDSAVTIGLLALVSIALNVMSSTSVFGAADAPIFDSLSKRAFGTSGTDATHGTMAKCPR